MPITLPLELIVAICFLEVEVRFNFVPFSFRLVDFPTYIDMDFLLMDAAYVSVSNKKINNKQNSPNSPLFRDSHLHSL